VADHVTALLPYYASVHRGAGYASQVCTTVLERARESVGAFVGARTDDVVVFTRNTTDALNLLAGCVPGPVLRLDVEHHANLLPWQRCGVRFLPVPESPAEVLEQLEAVLPTLPHCDDPHLVSVTGASNVTGELWPLAEIAEITHRHGARLMVDAAQLAPHAPINMERDGIDFLAFSGHKLYAPFGAGALIGERDWLSAGDPFLRGGGAVKLVTVDEVVWAELPDRQEAGSPNVIGAVALGVACDTLREVGMESVAAEEQELLEYARDRLSAIDGWEHYRVWPAAHPRVGLLTFNLRGVPYDLLAAVLSTEYGIGIRHGCFCAHPLMMRLLRVDDAEATRLIDATRAGSHERLPGAARMSLGLGSTRADIDALADALRAIAADGPHWTYSVDHATDMYEPDPDPRPLPDLPLRMVELPHGHGESA
jgi:selenocysteine lyase/cysteine desulfurase